MPQLPEGLSIVSANDVGLALPSVQAELRFAAYDVDVPADGAGGTEAALAFRPKHEEVPAVALGEAVPVLHEADVRFGPVDLLQAGEQRTAAPLNQQPPVFEPSNT